jgi:glycosyltransferase involved in cell wall biosynthesis
MKLKKVFDSSMFRKVIVTQKFTRDYLLTNNFCKPEEIAYVFGGVVPQKSLQKDLTDKNRYLKNKETFDICFCAAKYTVRGEDKGYDVFIEFAHKIAVKYDFICFHVIGGFSENDIDVSQIKEKIQFYGYQKFEGLSPMYKKMDVLVSPNKPFLLGKGAFDGFPLGTVVEAALNGVVTLISDELKQNSIFVPNEELIIIENKSSSIEKEVIDLILQPEKLYLISENGRQKFMKVYSNEIQMKPRIELLQKEIEKYK